MKKTCLSVQHLQTIIAVAETGSFTQAAIRLGLTQPGISHGIRELETNLGVRLFERRRGEGASLTNAGSRALIEARAALVHLERLEHTARAEAELLSGHLRLDIFPSAANTAIPAVLAAYHHRYPNVRLDVQENAEESVDRVIRNREVDLGMMALPIPSDLASVPAYEDELLVVMHEENPINVSGKISPLALIGEPFLMPHDATEHLVRSAFATAGVEPMVVLTAQNSQLLLEFVRYRLGITVLPSNSLRAEQLRQLKTFELHPRVFRRVVFAATSLESLSPAASAFVQMLSSQAWPG
jgi:DNA-binding transcriptional LysR family regulator